MGLLSHIQFFLTQQKVTTQAEVIEIEIHLEDTPGRVEMSTSLTKVKLQLTNLTMQLQDIAKEKLVRTYNVQRVEQRLTIETSVLCWEIIWRKVRQIHFRLGLRQNGVVFVESGDIYHVVARNWRNISRHIILCSMNSKNPWGMI